MRLLSLFLLIMPLIGYPMISGVVRDIVDHKVIEHVLVSLIDSRDSTILFQTKTDSNGFFLIKEMPNGNYLLFSRTGYESNKVKSSDNMEVLLIPRENTIKEVAITAGQVVQKANGILFIPREETIISGKTAIEMLNYIPSISVSNDNIEVLGRVASVVYVDKRKILSFEELKNLPADEIAKVEVEYLASVDNTASVDGGVVRITLKRLPNIGYTTNMSSAITFYDSPKFSFLNSETASFRARRDGMSLYAFSSVSFQKINFTEDYNFIFSDDKFSAKDATNRSANSYYGFLSVYNQIGKHGIGFSSAADARRGSSSINRDSEESLEDSNEVSDENDSNVMTNQTSHRKSYQVTGLYNLSDDKFTFTTGVDFLYVKTDKCVFLSSPNLDEQSDESSTNKFLEFNPKISIKLSNGDLQAGLTFQMTGRKEPFFSENSALKANGQVYAVYSSYSAKMIGDKLMYYVGCRYQRNDLNVNDGGINRSSIYNEICPQMSLKYCFGNNSISLSYKRSINEIPYSALTSFRNYVSPNQYFTGNPNLKQSTNNIWQVMYSHNNRHYAYVSYCNENRPIYDCSFLDPDNPDVIGCRPENGEYLRYVFAGIDVSFSPTKWWTFRTVGNVRPMWCAMQGEQVRDLSNHKVSVFSSFKFGDFAGAEIKYVYESKVSLFDFYISARHQINVSAYRYFLNKSLLVSLDAVPFFPGAQSLVKTNGAAYSRINHRGNEYICLRLSYKFGGGDVGNKTVNGQQYFEEYSSQKRQ